MLSKRNLLEDAQLGSKELGSCVKMGCLCMSEQASKVLVSSKPNRFLFSSDLQCVSTY
jgi:hypothetical protein